MKALARILFIIALLLSGAALAQTSREDFNQALAQVQANPNDQAAKEQVIKAALRLNPPPTIPV